MRILQGFAKKPDKLQRVKDYGKILRYLINGGYVHMYKKAGEVKLVDGNLLIPRSWSIQDFESFAAETDTFFEEDYDTVPCFTWTKFNISGHGIILEISVRDTGNVGDINIYEESEAGNEEYYVFNGFDIFTVHGEGENEFETDYLNDIAEGFYDWIR